MHSAELEKKPMQLYAAYKEGSSASVSQDGSGSTWLVCVSPVDDLIAGAFELPDSRSTGNLPDLPPTPAKHASGALTGGGRDESLAHSAESEASSGEAKANDVVFRNRGTQTATVSDSLQTKLEMLLDALRASQPGVSFQAPLFVR